MSQDRRGGPDVVALESLSDGLCFAYTRCVHVPCFLAQERVPRFL